MSKRVGGNKGEKGGGVCGGGTERGFTKRYQGTGGEGGIAHVSEGGPGGKSG